MLELGPLIYNAWASGLREPIEVWGPTPLGKMATIDVWDDVSNKSLVTRDINAADMAAGNNWSQFTLALPISAANNQIEIRTYWYATANMDVAAVRVR